MEELLPFERVKRELLVKKEEGTNPEYGKRPEERPTKEIVSYGVVNLNKPSGPSSHQISDYVKKMLNIDKAGHSGTLDPKVTGVLPIALGRATRITEALLPAGKEYVCLMHLHEEIPQSKIYKSAAELIGKIEQMPPLRSAVRRRLRTREIYYLNIHEIEGKEVLFRIGCEAGTYIRKICHDWSIKMGTRGNMAQLVRTKAGPFTDKDWVTLHDIKDAYELWKTEDKDGQLRKMIRPVEDAVKHLPKVWIVDSAVDTMCHGASLSIPGIAKLESEIKENDLVAVMSLKNELVCIGNSVLGSEEILKKDKGLAIRTGKVFMERETYPKWKKE